MRYTRTVSTSSPLSSSITGESVPGTGNAGVPTSGNLESWASWAQKNYRSNWHPIGTCAMMSKNLGGVVDSRYKVVSCMRR
jgi:choline dehydrogenase-like flavoprotein